MANRSLQYYLIKISRFTGWVLFVLVLAYIITGYALAGLYGFDKLMSSEMALRIHRSFDLLLVFVFLVHAGITIYFALKRWGWIKQRAGP